MCLGNLSIKELNISFQCIYFYLFIYLLGSFLSPDLSNMTMSIEYKICLPDVQMQSARHDINAVGEQSRYHAHFPLYLVTSVLNKELKNLLGLMEERKGDDFHL